MKKSEPRSAAPLHHSSFLLHTFAAVRPDAVACSRRQGENDRLIRLRRRIRRGRDRHRGRALADDKATLLLAGVG